MKNRLFGMTALLCAAVADELETQGGGAGAPLPEAPKQEAPDTEVPKQEAAAPPAEGKPGLISQVAAQLKDKATLNQEIATLKGERDTLQAENQRLVAENQRLTGEVEANAEDMKTLDAALKTTQAKVTTVDKAAAAKIVQAGFSGTSLPAAVVTASQSIEDLEEKLKAETDPAQRFKIQTKINALEEKEAAKG